MWHLWRNFYIFLSGNNGDGIGDGDGGGSECVDMNALHSCTESDKPSEIKKRTNYIAHTHHYSNIRIL